MAKQMTEIYHRLDSDLGTFVAQFVRKLKNFDFKGYDSETNVYKSM